MTLMVDRPAAGAADNAPDKPTWVTHPHDWVAAATIPIEPKVARHADLRGSFRTESLGVKIDVLEVYCGGAHGCRRPYDEVNGQPCQAKVNNEHLIGGNPGERKKRRPAEPVTELPAVRQTPGRYPPRRRPA